MQYALAESIISLWNSGLASACVETRSNYIPLVGSCAEWERKTSNETGQRSAFNMNFLTRKLRHDKKLTDLKCYGA